MLVTNKAMSGGQNWRAEILQSIVETIGNTPVVLNQPFGAAWR